MLPLSDKVKDITMSQSKHLPKPIDPVTDEMEHALQLARSTGASAEVIKSIESALEFLDLKEEFMLKTSSKESSVCTEIVEESCRHDWATVHREGKTTWHLRARMISGTIEGQFLKSIVSIQKARRVLDIGMFTGYSALSIAEALPADGEVVSLDIDEYLKTLVEDLTRASPHHKKMKIRIGKAIETLKQMVADGEKFDIIFLDADKSEYGDYLKFAFEDNLLVPGGTVVVDNAFLQGDGYIPSRGETVTKKFAEYVAKDSSLHKVLLPIRDGILLIRRLSDVEGGVE